MAYTCHYNDCNHKQMGVRKAVAARGAVWVVRLCAVGDDIL